MTFKEQWNEFGPEGMESPIQELHKQMRSLERKSHCGGLIFLAISTGLLIKGLYELYYGAYYKGVADSSESIYETLGEFK